MRAIRWAALASAFILAVPATSQTQKIIPPPTVYWMSAATQSGFGMSSAPSAADMMKMAMGGGGGTIRMLELDLGSKNPASGTPQADHFIPPVMAMGQSLPLRSAKSKEGKPTPHGDYERPKGKLLLFWGCGETARAGQPVVIDFAKVAAGQAPPGLFGGEQVRIARPPSQSGWPSWGRWPNAEKNGARSIPANASLIGPHKVVGNFSPELDFSLQQDWMQGIALSQAKTPAGAVALKWTVAPGATGHFAQMMAGKDEKGVPTVVFWSSSDVQTYMSALSDYVSPSEAARLICRKQLMPPTQTTCAVPKEAIAAAEGGIILLTTHGPEQNIIHPARPKDPKQPWVQEWSVKARFVSRSGAIIGMEDMAGGAATASGKPKCQPDAASEISKSAGGALAGGFGRAIGGAVGGLMGKKKKNTGDCEP